MHKQSAGILLYRQKKEGVEVFLVHPGGPYWKNKDAGVWSIPKGEYEDGDKEALATALREFEEETSFYAKGPFTKLTPQTEKSEKIIHAWACEGNCDPTQLKSNTLSIEWPPRTGKQLEIPEVDRGEWFTIAQAKEKIHATQIPFLDELVKNLK